MNNPDFEEYFLNIYAERWSEIKSALLKSEFQILRGCFGHESIEVTESNKEKIRERTEAGKFKYYMMDPASVIAAKALEVQDGDEVLDMCAAPGGKTLVLLESLLNKGSLVANEPSLARRDRLKKVIQQYAPDEYRPRVSIQGKDGVQFGLKFKESFYKILLDAPCSGERHLLHDEKEIKTWSDKRSKNLAKRQYALLCSALLALRAGGHVVYSTCSISPYENDGVIERILTRKSDEATLDLPEWVLNIKNAEKTEFGVILLPDRFNGGPIYFSRLKKVVVEGV